MRKVKYPDDLDSLKKNYTEKFRSVLPELEKKWSEYKAKYSSLRTFDISVEELLTLDYEGLVNWYKRYLIEVPKADRDKLCDKKSKSLYTECFNYTKFYDDIIDFFKDETNGFEFHVCHYCETAYINSFKIDKDEQIIRYINDASPKALNDLISHRYNILSRRQTFSKLKNLRPFENIVALDKEVGLKHLNLASIVANKDLHRVTFDLDHVLDKSSCPLVALSLFNFVPSCQVCNSRIKHSGVLGLHGIPNPILSPTCSKYDFDKEVKIRLHSKNGKSFVDPLEHKEEYELDFKTNSAEYDYEINFFKLRERYNYHVAEALRVLDLKQKYNDSALDMMSAAMGRREGYTPERIREDLLGIDFRKEHSRCFEKMYRDLNNDNNPEITFSRMNDNTFLCSERVQKRILIVTQYIYPETFKSSEMAFELAKRGYKVDVLTGIPNYPEGHYYKGYGLFSKRKEVKEGVTFYRCLQTPRLLLPGFIGMSVNYVTFAINASFWVLFYFAWKKRYDAIITHEPSPITQLIPACILGGIRKVPVYSWIMDIWPDSVVSSIGDNSKTKAIKSILNKVTNWTYRHSDKLLITSKGMAKLINRDFDYSDKIVYFPNWSDDLKLLPIEDIPTLPEGYRIMMAGNIADGLGIDSLVALLEEVKDVPEAKFIFVGGGNLQQSMADTCKSKGLENVYFLGKHPFSRIPAFYNQADAMLLTLKPTHLLHLDATVPARLQGYMAGGKPVLAMIGSGASDLIKEADCGYAVPAGDYKALARYIKEYVLENKDTFAQKGSNGRLYYEKHFRMDECISNLENIMFGTC